jgi:PAS domain S-box-containing protein
MHTIIKSMTSPEMKMTMDASYDGMIIVDDRGIVALFNKSAERITGLSVSRVLGRPAVDAIPNTRLPLVLINGIEELNQEQRIGDRVIHNEPRAGAEPGGEDHRRRCPLPGCNRDTFAL